MADKAARDAAIKKAARQSEASPFSRADRSTGVQQAAYERGVEDGWAWARGGPEPEGVGAVSPEPHERCPSLAPLAAGGPLRCELTVGHECEHYNGGTASGYWSDREAEPREGEQELEGIEFADGAKTWGRATPTGQFPHMGQHNRPEPPLDIAHVLRLTASRLRDPEYRWSEDPAVTLERLAEKLERSGDG